MRFPPRLWYTVDIHKFEGGDAALPFLITDSAAALPAETLPALKITHFYGAPRRGWVYAYLRCYVHHGTVRYCATVFDEAPFDTARLGLALTLDDAARSFLFLSLGKSSGARLRLYEEGGAVKELTAPAPHMGAGGDEQGLYWSAEGELPAAVFRTCFGGVPRAGLFLPGNVFLYDEAEAAFGAAFPVPAGETVPTAAGFEPFMVVPY